MIIPPNQLRRSTGKNKTIISPSQPKGGKAKNKSMIMTPSQPKGGKKKHNSNNSPLPAKGRYSKKKPRNKNYGGDYSGFWIRTDFFSLKFISSLILNTK